MFSVIQVRYLGKEADAGCSLHAGMPAEIEYSYMGAPGGIEVNDSSYWTNRVFFSAIDIHYWLLAVNACYLSIY